MPSPDTTRLNPTCPLTLVYGTASSLRQRVVDQIVAANLPEAEREWGLVAVSAPDAGPEGIVSILGSGSLMADTRVIVVRDLDKLTNAAQKSLARGVSTMPPATILVLDAQSSTEYSRKGPPVAADLRKAIEAAGQIIEAGAPADRELPAWVADEIAARGKSIAPPAAKALVETVGSSLELILSEIDKLVTYVGPDQSRISLSDVQDIVVGERENTVFDLVDAIGKRDARAALTTLPDLLPASGAQGAAMPILAMSARQLRLVWQARVLGAAGVNLERPGDAAEQWAGRLPSEHNFFEATKGRRFLITKYQQQARNFSDVQLVRAFVKVHETDLALKGQGEQRMDDRLALETLIISLCRL